MPPAAIDPSIVFHKARFITRYFDVDLASENRREVWAVNLAVAL